jgi:hypothetical protein
MSILLLKEKKELKKRVNLFRLTYDLRYFFGDQSAEEILL